MQGNGGGRRGCGGRRGSGGRRGKKSEGAKQQERGGEFSEKNNKTDYYIKKRVIIEKFFLI